MLSNIYFVLLAISMGLVFGDNDGITGAPTGGYCPPNVHLNPCTCYNNYIYCAGNEAIDLEAIFQRLSQNLGSEQKHFVGLKLTNTAITELKANTFKDIVFDDIFIEQALSLKRIDSFAFTGTNQFTKTLYFDSNPKLTQSADNSLFTALKTFVNIESLYLMRNNITEIPSNALYRHPHLANIKFNGKALSKIGSYAFKYLDSLQELEIKETSIDYIPYYAFEFLQKSEYDIKIELNDNPLLTPNSFSLYSLDYLRRPAQLYIGMSGEKTPSSDFNFLAMDPFWYFFYNYPKSIINMTGRTLDCSDCRNYWLIQYSDYQSRIKGLKCSNGKPFNDSSNFVGCK